MTQPNETFFNSTDPEITLPETIDPDKDYLVELVGEGKKFKTERDLARGKAESDLFAERLKRENAEMRTRLKESQTISALIDKMSKQPEPVAQPANSDNPKPEGQNESKSTEVDLDKLLEKKLQEREVVKTRDTNFNYVKAKLVESWGDDYSNKLLTKAKELGIGTQFLDDLAKTQPNAFLKLVDVNSTQQQTQNQQSLVTPPKSVVRSSPNTNNKKNYNYYKNIRKTQGDAVYYSPRVQNEMYQQLSEQGDDFYN